MNSGTLILQIAAAISILMAGAGAFRLLSSGSESIKRVPGALERSADAAERQAKVIETYADLAKTLYDLREGQEQIRITMSTVAGTVQALPCVALSPRPAAADQCEGQ
jgi:hypothetical protein